MNNMEISNFREKRQTRLYRKAAETISPPHFRRISFSFQAKYQNFQSVQIRSATGITSLSLNHPFGAALNPII